MHSQVCFSCIKFTEKGVSIIELKAVWQKPCGKMLLNLKAKAQHKMAFGDLTRISRSTMSIIIPLMLELKPIVNKENCTEIIYCKRIHQ